MHERLWRIQADWTDPAGTPAATEAWTVGPCTAAQARRAADELRAVTARTVKAQITVHVSPGQPGGRTWERDPKAAATPSIDQAIAAILDHQ